MEKKIYADKSLGQHYLIDQKIITEIIKEHQGLYKYVIEVGPGPGTLTKGLNSFNLPFHVLEMDQRFKASLLAILPEENMHFVDALNFNLEQLILENNWQGPGLIVSNLPYNISVPLFIKFLATGPIKYLTLMFQKEVAEKIHPFPSKKENEMGSLKSLAQTYFETKKLITVPPGAFDPPPQVQSTVISFIRRENPAIPFSEWPKLEAFCRRLFAHRRKQAQKVLKSYYTEEQIKEAFSQCQIKQTDRAEIFNLAQVHGLYNILGNKN